MVRKAAKRSGSNDPTAAIARTRPRTTKPEPPEPSQNPPETGPGSTETAEQASAVHQETPASAEGPQDDTVRDRDSRNAAAPTDTDGGKQAHLDMLVAEGRLKPGRAPTGPLTPPVIQAPRLDRRAIARLRTRLRSDAGRYARAREDMLLAQQEWDRTVADAREQGCPMAIIHSAAYEAGLADTDLPG